MVNGMVMRTERGFTMLAVLAAMAFLAMSVQSVMWIVSTQTQRDKELELLRVGSEIRDAIGRYVQSSPGTVKTWPPSLEALLEDKRLVTVRRHLRRVYPDPLNRKGTWGIVRAPDGGVAGVYSLSEGEPVRTGGVELAMFGVSAASSYSAWQFVYVPPLTEGAR